MVQEDRAWESWLSVCDCLSVLNKSQEDKTCYIHVCAQLRQEEGFRHGAAPFENR